MDVIHGGGQYSVIGDDLSNLALRGCVVPADVLDAWFDPAPSVIDVLRREAAWMCRTSPPCGAMGVEKVIAERYGLAADCVTIGAGSSDIIYRVLVSLLDCSSRVFLIDPTYSEYRNVCVRILRCQIEHGTTLLDLHGDYDLIVIVNPNNPTGEMYTRIDVASATEHLTKGGKVLVDEAYLPFVQSGESMRGLACRDSRVIVCQSLSKSLALSGLRAAFMVSSPELAQSTRLVMPPWLLSTAASLAVPAALGEGDYYEALYRRTDILRSNFAKRLRTLGGVEVQEGAANWVTLNVPSFGAQVIESCRASGVLLRDGSGMFSSPPSGFVRVAVRSEVENERCFTAIARAVECVIWAS